MKNDCKSKRIVEEFKCIVCDCDNEISTDRYSKLNLLRYLDSKYRNFSKFTCNGRRIFIIDVNSNRSFVHRVSFRDNTLYRSYRETNKLRHFFFFFRKFTKNKHFFDTGDSFSVNYREEDTFSRRTNDRLTFQSFNFRITKYYSQVILSLTTGRTTRYVSLAIVGFNDRNNRMKTKREKIAANHKNDHLASSLNEFTTSRILRSISNKETRMAIRLFRNDITVFSYVSKQNSGVKNKDEIMVGIISVAKDTDR